MNKVFLIGNLTKDPEVKTAMMQSTGTPLKIANLSLAVNDKKAKDGTVKVQYFNLTAFDKTAEIIEKYVKKGHKICITGTINNRSWDKPDGTKGYATDIQIQELEMLTTKMDADRLAADAISNPDSSPSYAPSSMQSQANPAPLQDDKLPIINVDELNVQMPF
jgi:single-strand DNA-binding protein